VFQQPQQDSFQDRHQGRGAVADGGDRPDNLLGRVPGLVHGQEHLRHQSAVEAGPFGGDNPRVVIPDVVPGSLGARQPVPGLHDTERDLTGGPDHGRPVGDGYLESGAYRSRGRRFGVVGPQVAGAPEGDPIQQAGGGSSHLGAQCVGRLRREQVPDRLAEPAVRGAVHAQHVPGRVATGEFGAGQGGFAPVGHPPRPGRLDAQQVRIPVDHPHGLAAGRGHHPGVAFGQHRGESATGRGGERERDRGGRAGQGVGCRHGITPSDGTAQPSAARN